MKCPTPAVLLLCLLALPPRADAGEPDRFAPPEIDTKQDLSGLALSQLKVLRNTVFALHGYEFETELMQRYFWNQPWYQRIRRRMEKAGEKFSPKDLTAAERAFVERVRAREKQIVRKAEKSKRPGQLYSYALIENTLQFPELSPAARRMIEDHGFVVLPAAHEQFFQLYEDNDYRMVPSFVTSDSVLQLYHVFFDFSLRDLERNKLMPAAVSLTCQLLGRARATLKRSKVPAVREAAALLVGYFAVARTLLTGKQPALPPAIAGKVRGELARIEAHRGKQESPLLGHKMDYSPFVPRGHYTRSDELKRYFRAMMWYGSVYFDPGRAVHLRAALLATYYLTFYPDKDAAGKSKLRALWDAIDETVAFYVGRADDLSPAQVRQATEEVFGAEVFKVRRFAEEKALAGVRRVLARLDPQRIKTTSEEVPNTGIRFMGQRYIPDSEIFQRLIEFPVRPFPKGLDLFAVFGHPEARTILDEHYEEPEKWAGYLPARRKLAEEFDALPDDAWRQNLYWSWLDSLRVLVRPAHQKAPPFAHTRAWRLKQLHTALGSWAELRHDTILYAKPFGAECGGGDEPPRTRGYVEPVPAFFARLRALLSQNREGLRRRKLLTERFDETAGRMDELLAFLEKVARKQLAGEEITRPEYEQIRLYGSTIGYLTTALLSDFQASRWYEVKGPDRSVAVVADIGSTSGQVLEEAVGTVDEIYVVVEIDGEPVLTRGGVFSYYEFTWPASDRLTDEKWQKMLKEDKAPPRPDWIEGFFHPRKCPAMPDVLFYSSGC